MRISIIVILLASAMLSAPISCAAEPRSRYRLVFPPVQLNEKKLQLMDEIHFTVACGHIESISWVPEMWNIEIVRSISVVEEFRASAGLGAARLDQKEINKFSGAITISVLEDSCFKVEGAIIIGGEEWVELPISNANLHRAK
jgi:hypothetical protein